MPFLPRSGSDLACFVELQGQTTTIALPVLFIHHYLLTVPRCASFHPLPVRHQEGCLWRKQGKLFLEKNERGWKIQSYQYFTYAITIVKELIIKAAVDVCCITHQKECQGYCTLAASGAMKAPHVLLEV